VRAAANGANLDASENASKISENAREPAQPLLL